MADDGRIARLQRLAYGAGVAEADRAAAEAELAGLRDAGPGGPGADLDRTGLGPQRAAVSRGPDAPEAADPADAFAGERPAPSRGRSGLVAAPRAATTAVAGVALVAGIALGWSAATRPDPTAGSGAAEPATAAKPAIPFEDVAAMAVFDRDQVDSDRTPITDGRIWVDRATQRRLLTLSDGATVTAVRTVNGADVCLLIEHPRQGGGSTCLQDPRFPADGITLDVALDGTAYDLVWKPSGEIGVRRFPVR